MARTLVTGASGFIGARVMRSLKAHGHEAHGVCRLPPLSSPSGGPWHAADLLEPEAARRLVAGINPEILVHLAWETKHGEFWESPANLQWISATVRLAEAFVKAGGRRFVGMGSCAEYSWDGLEEGRTLDESSPCAPSTRYGAAKNDAFEKLSRFFEREGVQFAWARLFFPYGPGDRRPTLIPSMIRALMCGQPARSTWGTQVRDFIYVDDVAAAVTALANSGLHGAFNIASGVGVRVAEVARLVGQETGRLDLWRPGTITPRDGDVQWLVGCPNKLASQTGWLARESLGSGIRETVRWWRELR